MDLNTLKKYSVFLILGNQDYTQLIRNILIKNIEHGISFGRNSYQITNHYDVIDNDVIKRFVDWKKENTTIPAIILLDHIEFNTEVLALLRLKHKYCQVIIITDNFPINLHTYLDFVFPEEVDDLNNFFIEYMYEDERNSMNSFIDMYRNTKIVLKYSSNIIMSYESHINNNLIYIKNINF